MIIIIQDPDLMASLQDSGLIISHPHNLEWLALRMVNFSVHKILLCQNMASCTFETGIITVFKFTIQQTTRRVFIMPACGQEEGHQLQSSY